MTKEETLEFLESALRLEVKTRDDYKALINKLKNKNLIERLSRIRGREIEHIRLVERAIVYIGKYQYINREVGW